MAHQNPKYTDEHNSSPNHSDSTPSTTSSNLKHAYKHPPPNYPYNPKASKTTYEYDPSAQAFLDALPTLQIPTRRPDPMFSHVLFAGQRQGEFARYDGRPIYDEDESANSNKEIFHDADSNKEEFHDAESRKSDKMLFGGDYNDDAESYTGKTCTLSTGSLSERTGKLSFGDEEDRLENEHVHTEKWKAGVVMPVHGSSREVMEGSTASTDDGEKDEKFDGVMLAAICTTGLLVGVFALERCS